MSFNGSKTWAPKNVPEAIGACIGGLMIAVLFLVCLWVGAVLAGIATGMVTRAYRYGLQLSSVLY